MDESITVGKRFSCVFYHPLEDLLECSSLWTL